MLPNCFCYLQQVKEIEKGVVSAFYRLEFNLKFSSTYVQLQFTA